MTIELIGYSFSVYTRAVRIALSERGLRWRDVEVDPFERDGGAELAQYHPFGRVPVLVHDGFSIYETAAILRYIDLAFDGPSLVPKEARAAARMVQVGAISDSYGYWPLVRQVYAHRVFRLAEGRAGDEAEIAAGLVAARPVLASLETIAAEGRVLNGRDFTLADCHLTPMIAAFAQAPEGAAMLREFPALAVWWAATRQRPSISATQVGLPKAI